jgi:hypothetical protein
MQIIGVDFTSAPSPRKPITVARATLDDRTLAIERVDRLVTFEAFDSLLAEPGPWIGGFDFPFGQPRCLVEALPLGHTWSAFVGHVATLTMPEWVAALDGYRAGQPPGRKQPPRATDQRAGARSPMMLWGVPVGRMFFRAAPRLLASGASIIPCRPTSGDRIAVEAYPALFAGRGYKCEPRRLDTGERRAARQRVVQRLRADEPAARYGIRLALPRGLATEMVDDHTGDTVDAVICAMQAAWAAQQGPPRYGVPEDADALEGWIVDPSLAG